MPATGEVVRKKSMHESAKKVLIVAYFFPPVGGIASAGSQRAAKFSKYLSRYGWRPVVLTIREDAYEDYYDVDPSLLAKLPSDLAVIRTPVIRLFSRLLDFRSGLKGAFNREAQGMADQEESSAQQLETPGAADDSAAQSRVGLQAFKDAISDLFEIPDGQAGWVIPAVRQGLETIRREEIRAIMATGKPWSALVVGAILSRLTGKPLLSDFRDPWMTNPYRQPGSAVKNFAESKLERMVVRRSSKVIANTDELRDEFLSRFPSQSNEKFVSLYNGFDPADFADVVDQSPPQDGVFRILHAGFLYGLRDPRTFLEGLSLAIRRGHIDGRRVELTLFGSIELDYGLPDILRELGLEGVVLAPGQVPFEQVSLALSASDLLLILQPGTKTQVPSKLFEYLAFGKPILAVTPPDGASGRLVSEGGFGQVASSDDTEEIARALALLYRQWVESPRLEDVHSEHRQRFNIERITGRLADLLDSAC